MFYTLFINNEGVPGILYDSMTWEKCLDKICSKVDKACLDRWFLDSEGYLETPSGTWYILQSQGVEKDE